MTDRAETIVAMIGQLAVLPREEALARVREVVAKHEQAPQGEPSDEEIDSIAASMPDGLGGMLKQWGYRQFARALLSRYAAPQADTWPGRFFGVDLSSNGIEDVRNAALEEAANLMDEDGRRSAAVLIRALKSDTPIGDAAQAQPKRRPYNASGSLSEYGVFPECDAAPATEAPAKDADVALPHPLGIVDPDPTAPRVYTVQDLANYARAAVLADRQQRGGDVVSAIDAAMQRTSGGEE